MILTVLPVTTATVEHSFSCMKLVKAMLRSRMGEDTLESTMRICIEGSDSLDGKFHTHLDMVIYIPKIINQQREINDQVIILSF